MGVGVVVVCSQHTQLPQPVIVVQMLSTISCDGTPVGSSMMKESGFIYVDDGWLYVLSCQQTSNTLISGVWTETNWTFLKIPKYFCEQVSKEHKGSSFCLF